MTVLVGIIHMLSGKNEIPHQSSLPGSSARTQHKHTTASLLGAYFPSPGAPEQASAFTCQRVPTSWKGTSNLVEKRPFQGQELCPMLVGENASLKTLLKTSSGLAGDKYPEEVGSPPSNKCRDTCPSFPRAFAGPALGRNMRPACKTPSL